MDFGEGDSKSRNKENGDELQPIHQAAASGDVDLLVKVIQEDPSLLELQDGEELTPLGRAVQNEHLGAVKRLVKMGAQINVQDGLGRTCLSIAAYQGWYDGVVYLLRNGARKTICDTFGRTPLHAATYDTDKRTLTLLLQNMSENEVDCADNECMTALHWAAFHDRPTHLQQLLEKRADILAQDIDGKAPLHWAAQNGSKKCCEILCNWPQGSDLVNDADHSGKTPVHFAAAAGHSDILQLLAGVPGCDLEAQDPDDRTPLHWAAATGQSECVRTLLTFNVTPDPVDIDEETPLEYAKESGHTECASLLAKKLGIKNGKSNLLGTENNGKSGPFTFLKSLFLRNSSVKTVTKVVDTQTEKEQNENINNVNTVSQFVPYKSPSDNVRVPVPTILVQQPGEVKELPRRKRKGSAKKRVISTPSEDTIAEEIKEQNSVLETDTALPEGLAHWALPTRPLSVLHGKSMSFPLDSNEDTGVSSVNRPSRRSLSLKPLPDRPAVKISEDRSPSPSVSPRRLGPLDTMDPPVSPRSAVLGPLRGHKPKPDMLVNSRIASLQKERTGANRTPTPPPSDVDAKILKLHPGLSPLTAGEHPLTHRRKQTRSTSLLPETEYELNCMGSRNKLSPDRHKHISPLARDDFSSSVHRRHSDSAPWLDKASFSQTDNSSET